MLVSKNMRQNDVEVTVRKGRMSKEICVKCQGIIRGGILSEMIARSKCTKLTTFNTFFKMFFLEIFLKNIPYKYSGQLFLTIIPYIYYNYNNIIMN